MTENKELKKYMQQTEMIRDRQKLIYRHQIAKTDVKKLDSQIKKAWIEIVDFSNIKRVININIFFSSFFCVGFNYWKPKMERLKRNMRFIDTEPLTKHFTEMYKS